MDFSTISAWLGRIETKVDRILRGPPVQTVDVAGAMLLTGDKSKTAFYRTVISLGVRPFKRGHYRRTDLVNAIGRRSIELQRRAKSDAHSEIKTEAQRHQTTFLPE